MCTVTLFVHRSPYLWQDPRGNWHALVHRYDYSQGDPWDSTSTPVSAPHAIVSAHAFSLDATTWHFSLVGQPFGPWVSFDDGTAKNFSSFERPKLVFDPETGVPTHSVHGVSPVWDGDGDGAAQRGGTENPCGVCERRFGTMHSCSVCKTTQGHDHTYTLIQKLNSRPH